MTIGTTLNGDIAAMFSEKLNLDVPAADTDLVDAGLLDSLTFVELLLLLEQEFGIEITIDNLEIDDFRSISRIAMFVARQNV